MRSRRSCVSPIPRNEAQPPGHFTSQTFQADELFTRVTGCTGARRPPCDERSISGCSRPPRAPALDWRDALGAQEERTGLRAHGMSASALPVGWDVTGGSESRRCSDGGGGGGGGGGGEGGGGGPGWMWRWSEDNDEAGHDGHEAGIDRQLMERQDVHEEPSDTHEGVKRKKLKDSVSEKGLITAPERSREAVAIHLLLEATATEHCTSGALATASSRDVLLPRSRSQRAAGRHGGKRSPAESLTDRNIRLPFGLGSETHWAEEEITVRVEIDSFTTLTARWQNVSKAVVSQQQTELASSSEHNEQRFGLKLASLSCSGATITGKTTTTSKRCCVDKQAALGPRAEVMSQPVPAFACFLHETGDSRFPDTCRVRLLKGNVGHTGSDLMEQVPGAQRPRYNSWSESSMQKDSVSVSLD
ncbi:unnamed protein product [Pleuronectes platessa]|uniref:Uncharacterized protein n=1 Tax=Pleuronectes platessa TaxID=8262 RepID=A0A9N7V181_PLEPL|nr:unnamed protein product [Pleuronectes platessa]